MDNTISVENIKNAVEVLRNSKPNQIYLTELTYAEYFSNLDVLVDKIDPEKIKENKIKSKESMDKFIRGRKNKWKL